MRDSSFEKSHDVGQLAIARPGQWGVITDLVAEATRPALGQRIGAGLQQEAHHGGAAAPHRVVQRLQVGVLRPGERRIAVEHRPNGGLVPLKRGHQERPRVPAPERLVVIRRTLDGLSVVRGHGCPYKSASVTSAG